MAISGPLYKSPTAVSNIETQLVKIVLLEGFSLLLNTSVYNYASLVVYSGSPLANLMLFKCCKRGCRPSKVLFV